MANQKIKHPELSRNKPSLLRRWWPLLVVFAILAFLMISSSLITLAADYRKERINQFLQSLGQQGVDATIRSDDPNWIVPYKRYLPASVVDSFAIKETSVKLAGDKVTRHSLTLLTQLPNVTALFFEDTPNIDDDSLAVLSELKSLERLDMNGTRLSGEGFVHLQNLPELRQICFYGTIALTEKGIEQLLRMRTMIRVYDIELESIKSHGFELTGPNGSKSIKVGDLITVRGSFTSKHFVPKYVSVIAARLELREIEGGATSDSINFFGAPTSIEKGVYQFNITSKTGMQYPGRYRVEVDFTLTEMNGNSAIWMKLGAMEFDVK